MCHIFQAARWYSALETKAAPPTFSSEKRGIPAKQEAPLISDLAAAMSSSDGANETSEAARRQPAAADRGSHGAPPARKIAPALANPGSRTCESIGTGATNRRWGFEPSA